MGTLSFMFTVPSIFFFFFFKPSSAVESITQSQSISDGRTLVSKEGTFELGFFSPGNSKNCFLGIWYKKIPVRTVVWLANRSNPINDSSGILMINSTGSLVLSQNKTVVWSTTTSSLKQAQNPVLQLLDSGNLVLREENDGNPENYLWQSFDYPTDTLLPGMKFGWNLKTSLNRRLSAWKSLDDPSPGDLTLEMEHRNYPEALMRKGSKIFYRTGPWNGIGFSGSPLLDQNSPIELNFVSNADEVVFNYSIRYKDVISIVVLNQSGSSFQQRTWSETDQTWRVYVSFSIDQQCDTFGNCGAYGNCLADKIPVCRCLRGFKPKSQEKWDSMNWSQGCVRNKPLGCQDNKDRDVFFKFEGLKLPDTNSSWMNPSMNLKDCKANCLNNCSCMAYANSDIRGGGSGCAMWFGDLIDIKQFSAAGGQDLYIRMSASESESKGDHKLKIAVIIIAFLAVVSGTLVVGYCICRSRRNFKGQNNEDGTEDMELPMFDISTIGRATDNFSINNKLGEGGFGPVYRGVLIDGQEIAVKRLSRSSGQGLNEFKNEVLLIAKLQHRNLVRLLGCCIQGEEKMLVYEYMPNKSLDYLIFDQTGGTLLNWSKRFQIICGIARGLLYLHQDSILRIIHRDLKASNVLLDSEMNPKISDFGMARMFGGDETEGSTNRVVGTIGYMAPEYVAEGLFSTKSDVYSFGILLLEIVSGKKNRGFNYQDQNINLIGYAWILWKEGKPLELMDASLEDSHTLSEVLRCIHVSLLCVQHSPEDRPSMSSVVLMLSSECALPQPKQPGFFVRKDSLEAQSSSSKLEFSSTKEITTKMLEAR